MDGLRRLADMLAAAALARRKAARDRWTPERLRAFRTARLGALLRHAARATRLYGALYRGLDLSDPVDLRRLPETGKRLLMERFEDGLADPRLTRAEIMGHAAALRGDALLRGRYRVIATTGTSGLRGHFVYDRAAWRGVLADTLRWHGMIGLAPRLGRRIRVAAIGADAALHVSSRVALSGDVGLFRIRTLPATAPVSELADALGAFAPEALFGYPSLIALLALERLEGRLAIAPRLVATHSETLTQAMRARIRAAWGVDPFDHYGLTEAPHVAAECAEHRGLHVFEDGVILEPVDEAGAPVPPGRPAARWLLTNLDNRAQPIIRYAVDDSLTLSPEPCPCGRPGRLIAALGGRREDALRLPAAAGSGLAVVSPHAVALAVEALPDIAEYAVAQQGARVVAAVVPRRGAEAAGLPARVSAALEAALAAAGAAPEGVETRLAETLPRGRDRVGKLRLVTGGAAPASGAP